MIKSAYSFAVAASAKAKSFILELLVVAVSPHEMIINDARSMYTAIFICFIKAGKDALFF